MLNTTTVGKFLVSAFNTFLGNVMNPQLREQPSKPKIYNIKVLGPQGYDKYFNGVYDFYTMEHSFEDHRYLTTKLYLIKRV